VYRFLAILTAWFMALLMAVSFCPLLKAQDSLPQAPAEDRALAREIFKELVEINTTDTPQGNVTTATAAMERRLLDAGFSPQDVRLLGPDDRKKNLVVRFRAAGTDAMQVGLEVARELVAAALGRVAGIEVIAPFKAPLAALDVLPEPSPSRDGGSSTGTVLRPGSSS